MGRLSASLGGLADDRQLNGLDLVRLIYFLEVVLLYVSWARATEGQPPDHPRQRGISPGDAETVFSSSGAFCVAVSAAASQQTKAAAEFVHFRPVETAQANQFLDPCQFFRC
jgi:hypothetical protein